MPKKVKIGGDLLTRMQNASQRYSVTLSEIASRAMTSYSRRSGVALPEDCNNATRDGTVLTVNTDHEPAVVRSIISWYLKSYEDNPPKMPKPVKIERVKTRKPNLIGPWVKRASIGSLDL